MSKQYKNIQIAIDGSKEADVAFKSAVEIAILNDANLEILHVVLSLIHISEPTRRTERSRMPSSA